ncbi:MAG: hypothetical protein R2729_09350, partial [Bryobacteraceae bacterium]
IHLGLFDILEDAIAARREAELKYFGSFAGTANQQPNEQTPTRKKPPVREVNPKPDAPPKTEAA